LKKIERNIQFVIIVGIIFFVNVIANYFHGYLDLTEEKRFTLSESTEDVVESLDDILFVRILLDGELPGGFKRLQNATIQLMDDLNSINPNVEYEFEDVLDGTKEEVKNRREQLSEMGVIPIALKFFNGTEYTQKGIYPYALVTYEGRTLPISLLKEQVLGEDEEITLNKSIELLEYKFANHIQKLTKEAKQNIAFARGHGELTYEQTIRIETELRALYNVGRLDLDSLVTIDKALDLLIIAAPKETFDEQTKFKIDQYIMNGGKVLWMLEKLEADLDSIAKYTFYVPPEIETNLDDMLFKYGVRIQPDLVLDLESTVIPQIVGSQGGKPQTMFYKWYYHPLAMPNQNHPIGKNLDRVNLFFPSSLDTIRTKYKVEKTPLLTTSPYSRYQLNPVRLNFQILKDPPVTSKFNKGKIPLAYLLEGTFESVYANRITPDFQAGLDQLNIEFKEKSEPTKQIVITDADFAKNLINTRNNSAEPIGFNKWENKVFEANKDFVLNCIQYLLDDNGVLESRSKEITLRLLDSVKTKEERKKWQFINIGLPLLFLGLFGLGYNYYRRRKYSIKK